MPSPPRKVLIIDDDEIFLEIARRRLRRIGWRVLPFTCPETGLRQARAAPPDAVIVDLRMPATSGLKILTDMAGHAELAATRRYLATSAEPPTEIAAAVAAVDAQVIMKDDITDAHAFLQRIDACSNDS